MKSLSGRGARRVSAAAMAAAMATGMAGVCPLARAANQFWDTNGATAGAGGPVPTTGTWGVSNFWSTSSAGTAATGAWVTGNTAFFSAGTDATGAYAVIVSGTQTASGIVHEDGTLTLTGGTISLTGGTIDVLPSRQLTVASTLSGTAGLIKNQAGTLVLNGINSYSGATTVNAGTLRLGISAALPTAALTVAGGTVDLNGFNQTAGDLTFGNGASTTAATVSGAGTLTLNGNLSFNGEPSSNTPPATLASNVTLSSGTHSVLLPGQSSNGTYDLVISGAINGSGGLNISGLLSTVLTTQNSYTGGTTMNTGELFLAATNALPTSTALVLVGGATLVMDPVQAQAGVTPGSYDQTVGSLSGDGTVLMGNATLTVGNNNTSTTFSGFLSAGNSATLIKVGTGTLTLAGLNTHQATTISAGTLRLAHSQALQNSIVNYNTGGGTLSFGPLTAASFAGLSGNKNLPLVNESSQPVALTLGVSGKSTTYSGVLSGASSSLTKAGSGTLTLTASNPVEGAVLVSLGTISYSGGGWTPASLTLTNGAFSNNGVLTLDGLTVTGNGSFNNLVPLATRGVIATNVQNFNTTLSAKGGNLTLGAPGKTLFNSGGTLANLPSANLFVEATTISNLGSITVNAGGGVVFDVAITSAATGAPTLALRGGVLATPTLTNVAGVTLNGYGQITGNLVNSSTLVDFYGPTVLEGNVTNNSGGVILVRNAETLITGSTTNNGTIHVGSGGSVVFMGGPSGNPPTSTALVDPGASMLASFVRQDALTIDGSVGSTGVVKLRSRAEGADTSVVNTLTITGGSTPPGKLDLRDTQLVIHSGGTGSFNGTTYTGPSGLIRAGRNGGNWSGNGIVTSESAATGGSNFTSIGIATAAQAKSIAATATAVWAGQTVTGSDTLVMYTYGGDANLDGKINVDDYGRIDFNVNLGSSGWFNGDFNYDGKINVDDYGIIDFNVGIQGAPFPAGSAAMAPAASLSAVPEPASILSAGATLLTLAATRRRRRGGDVPRGTFP